MNLHAFERYKYVWNVLEFLYFVQRSVQTTNLTLLREFEMDKHRAPTVSIKTAAVLWHKG